MGIVVELNHLRSRHLLCIGFPVILLKCSPSFCSIFIYTFDVLANVLFFVAVLIGFAAFAANVMIQFGIDQLPARDCFLFIHWFIFTLYFGISLGRLHIAW